MKLADGIHQMEREQYDALTSYRNFSTLKAFAKSPAHFRETLLNKKTKDTDAYRLGRCIHWATYEPEVFRENVVVWDCGDRRGKEWNEFKDRNQDKTILKAAEYEQCRGIGAAVRNNPMTAKYVSGGQGEQTILWTFKREAMGSFKAYSVPMKSRLDFLKIEECITDLKSCQDASPDGFGKACWNYLYHCQAAMYQDAVFAVTGKRLPYVLIAAEKTAPFVTQVYRLPDHLLQLGRETYQTWMDQLALCRQTSNWPGYAEAELELSLPRWAAPAEDDVGELGLSFGESA